MSDKTLEFFFDFGSPTTYLAHTQLPRIAHETGAQLVYKPMLLGGVFKATGNASPVSVPAKGRWMNRAIARWAARYGVRFAAITQLGDRVQCSGKVVEKLTHAGRPCARIELTAAKASGEVTLAGEALVALD